MEVTNFIFDSMGLFVKMMFGGLCWAVALWFAYGVGEVLRSLWRKYS